MLNASSARLRRVQGLSARPAAARPEEIRPEPAAQPVESDLDLIVASDDVASLDFARECGASDGLAIRVEPSGAPPQDLEVPSGLVLVGQSPHCTLQVPGAGVGDKHLLALFLQGKFFVLDFGAPGGTWLGSRRVTSSWVPAGTALRVGDARIVLEGPVATESDDASADGAEISDELWLSYPRNAGDQRYRLEKSVTVFGRDSRCRVRISNRSVSRFHCVLVRTASGVWVADLASREGIRVNGERVGMARIDDDCELMIGATRLQLHRGSELADEPVEFQAAEFLSNDFAPGPGHVSEDFVRELLAELRQTQRETINELRQTQRETIAEMSSLLRDILRASAPAISGSSQVEALLRRIEGRMASASEPSLESAR